jgi:chemotaxis protein MotB
MSPTAHWRKNNEALQLNMSKNRDLLSQLDAKGKALAMNKNV